MALALKDEHMTQNRNSKATADSEVWEDVAISILCNSVLRPFHVVQKSLIRWGSHK